MKILDYIERIVRYLSPEGRRQRRNKKFHHVGEHIMHIDTAVWNRIRTTTTVTAKDGTKTIVVERPSVVSDVKELKNL